MFVRFAAEAVTSARTEEASPGVMLDFDPAGVLIGIEVLDVRERAIARPVVA